VLNGALQLTESDSYQFAIFSLPKERKIRCQCIRVTKPCNLPIYSKIVFITNGKDFCVHGFSCATTGVLKQATQKTVKSLSSVPELTLAQIEEVKLLIANNIADVIDYLVALRDSNEAVIRLEERRLGAKRLSLSVDELEAIRFKHEEEYLAKNLAKNLAKAAKDEERRVAKHAELQKRLRIEKRFACAHSLSIAAANWLNIRTTIADVIAYSEGRGKLPSKVVEKIYSDDAYEILRPSELAEF
jgi:hypothetical protein